MTREFIYHGTPATQVTIKVSVANNNMSRANQTTLESWAVDQEVIFGVGNVFTIDVNNDGILPRNVRPT